jgi:peptidoglycan/xylan/chitin deacetylase (PgdA/CDA1 family)
MSATDHRTPASTIAGALGGVAMASYLLPGLAGVCTPNGAPVFPLMRRALGVEDATSSGHGYALTFDDGPHRQGTPAVLEILARERVTATFFLVGEQLRRNPSLGAEILAAGHEIALHCDRHRNLLRLTPWQVREDIARARETIEAHTGRSPALYRPPYGALNAPALGIARRHAWRTLLWGHWARDWEARATPELIAERVTSGVGEGSVLLLHDADDYSAPDSWRRTVAALPWILDTLRERGLESTRP